MDFNLGTWGTQSGLFPGKCYPLFAPHLLWPQKQAGFAQAAQRLLKEGNLTPTPPFFNLHRFNSPGIEMRGKRVPGQWKVLCASKCFILLPCIPSSSYEVFQPEPLNFAFKCFACPLYICFLLLHNSLLVQIGF